MAERPITVQTVGGFRMLRSETEDITPRGAKARGLVALLCLTPERRRSRRWLESRLWSDRGPEQASGSLRQALTEIRRHLGADRDLFVADREEVWLRAEGFQVDLEAEPAQSTAALEAGRELLEGLEIRDPAFVAWLAERRQRLAADLAAASYGPPSPQRLSLELVSGTDGSRDENLLALALAQQASKLMSEYALVDIVAPGSAQVRVGPQEHGLRLRVDALADSEQTHILARLEATPTCQVLWSSHASIGGSGPGLISDMQFQRLAHYAAETAMQLIPRLIGQESGLLRAEALTARALREMFSFDTARLRIADGLLAEAARLMPSGRVDAWLGLLRMFMMVERTEDDPARMREEAEAYTRKAMERERDNALVIAIAGKVRVLATGDVAGGGALALDAIALSPGNPIGLSGLATAKMRDGHLHEALALARRGTAIARNSPFLHWWELFSCLAQIATGDFAGATLSAEAVHARAPNFRAPLRHLYALYTHRGDVEGAHRIATRLRRLEPDFSLRTIRENPDYPASILRASPLIDLPDIVL